MDSAGAADPPTGQLDRLALFAFFWALAVLLHQTSYSEWSAGALDFCLTALATLVLIRPRWLLAFAALLTAQLADVLYELPWVSNHWLLAGCAAATMLAAPIGLYMRRPRGRLDRDRVYQAFAPWLRLQLLVLYGYAVLHKLNHDFLDPSRSCATVHSSALVDGLGLAVPIEAMSGLVIVGTLVVEALIPVLLCFRRTSKLGILIGVAFHGAIGLNIEVAPFYNFSSLLIAFYVLFLPDDFCTTLQRKVRSLRERIPWPSQCVLRSGRWLLVATLVLLVLYAMVRGHTWQPSDDVIRVLWSLLAASFGVLVVVGWPPGGQGRPALWGRPRVMAAFPALLLLNGLCPYVGLKTETSFAMFSNLRTEGDLGNHLFLSNVPRVAAFQNDLVELIDSSDPRLARLAKTPLRMIFFELHAYLHHRPELSVRYRQAGRIVDVRRVGDDPIFSQPPNTLQRKLLAFRPVDPRGFCQH